MTDTTELAQALIECEKLYEDLRNTEMDQRIAERDGGDIEAAKAATKIASTAWHDSYLKGGDLAKRFATDHGLDPKLLSRALAR